MRVLRHWLFPLCILVATCLGVFVVPFLFPPPYLAGISEANVAGFNNKVASVAAAAISVLVFLTMLRWPRDRSPEGLGDYGRLSKPLVLISTTVFGCCASLVCWLVVRSRLRYVSDAGYFVEQISQHVEYGRKLYAQIDFPYGPLLFYAPLAVRRMLSPMHLSIEAAYFVTLVIEYVVGLLLVAYILDSLPILRRWKNALFLLSWVAAIQANLGSNYTFFRFVTAAAFLVLGTRRKRPWASGLAFLAGELVSLTMSPEFGPAFLVASVAYAGYRCYQVGRSWAVALVAPFIGVAGFLLLIDRSYLLMLKLFARGIFNFVVEPLPHIIIFLFALIWLVPCMLARFFRDHRPEAPSLAALYLFSLGLLPVAFGRADPGHVFFNGFIIFLLSAVAISTHRFRMQALWVLCLAGIFLGQAYLSVKAWRRPWSHAIELATVHKEWNGGKRAILVFLHTFSFSAASRALAMEPVDHSFDLGQLNRIVGGAPVATPQEIPLYVEDALKSSHQYIPSYYCAMIVTDAAAEDRVIREMNESEWALLPKDLHYRIWESPANTKYAMGFQITYPTKHKPFVLGEHFDANVAARWQPYGEVGIYEVYRRRW